MPATQKLLGAGTSLRFMSISKELCAFSTVLAHSGLYALPNFLPLTSHQASVLSMFQE